MSVLNRQAGPLQVVIQGSGLFPSWLCHLLHSVSKTTSLYAHGVQSQKAKVMQDSTQGLWGANPVRGIRDFCSQSMHWPDSVTWPVPTIKVN